MNATATAIRICIWRWHHAPVSLEAYRARKWLIKHTRPMPQKDPPEDA
jgi:hypothetical protein